MKRVRDGLAQVFLCLGNFYSYACVCSFIHSFAYFYTNIYFVPPCSRSCVGTEDAQWTRHLRALNSHSFTAFPWNSRMAQQLRYLRLSPSCYSWENGIGIWGKDWRQPRLTLESSELNRTSWAHLRNSSCLCWVSEIWGSFCVGLVNKITPLARRDPSFLIDSDENYWDGGRSSKCIGVKYRRQDSPAPLDILVPILTWGVGYMVSIALDLWCSLVGSSLGLVLWWFGTSLLLGRSCKETLRTAWAVGKGHRLRSDSGKPAWKPRSNSCLGSSQRLFW